MSEAKHTPGPWHVSDGGFVDDANDNGICQLWYMFVEDFTNEDFPNAQANARLIAAAPELLAALKLALENIADGCGPEEVKIRAAIAKAEGRS